MPWQYRVDAERGWLVTTMTGAVSYAEICAHIRKERADGHPERPELIVGVKVKAAFSPAEARDLILFIRNFATGKPFGPTAVVVDSDYTFGMLRMFEMLVEDVAPVRVFREQPEAEAWLITNGAHPAT